MNFRSIAFRLVVGGCVAVAVPLMLIGYIAVSKTSQALSDISRESAAIQAQKLAALVESTMEGHLKTAAAHAADTSLRLLGEKVKNDGLAAASAEIAQLRLQMKSKFKQLDSNYLGIFVTDEKGLIYTGELANGEEYKGSDVSLREYFQQAKTTNKPAAGDFVISKQTGAPICVFSAPILSRTGEFLGIFGMSLKTDSIAAKVSDTKVGSTGYAYMVNNKGIVIAHPKKEHEMKLDLMSISEMTELRESMLAGKQGSQRYVFQNIPKVAGYAPVPLKQWSIAVTQNEAEFLGVSQSIRNTVLMLTLAATVLVSGVVLLFSRSITRPLTKAVAGLKDIANGEGDLTMRLKINSRDEVGDLAVWFNLFIEKLQGIIGQVANNTRLIDGASVNLVQIAAALSAGSRDTSQRAESAARATDEMNNNLNNVAAAIEQSTTNTSMVASAAEEMTATISEIARNSQKAHSISLAAVETASNTATRMTELGIAARNISKVTETITEISEQTNLLALNATIEAARAGEAGKGFAVVANEIKELARQTAAATQDIKKQIEEVQNNTETTVLEINRISDVINTINDIVGLISTSVTEQSTATQEIATNIAQASQGLSEVNKNACQSSVSASEIAHDIATVDAASTDLSENSGQVRNSAEELQQLAAVLKELINGFKI